MTASSSIEPSPSHAVDTDEIQGRNELPDLMWIIVLRDRSVGDFYFERRASALVSGEYNPALLD
jgi:hypothetical protein